MHSTPQDHHFARTLPKDYLLCRYAQDQRDEDLCNAIEDLANKEGTGADFSSEDTYVIATILHDGHMVGAVWGDQPEDEVFTFHVAVDSAHQQRGLGHVLIEHALHEYLQRLETDPSLELEVLSIHPGVTKALYHHGFMVTEDLKDDMFDCSYTMKPVSDLSEIILKSSRNNPTGYKTALTQAAQVNGLPVEMIDQALKSWSQTVIGSSSLQLHHDVVHALFDALPIPDYHKELLRVQHQKTSETPHQNYEPQEPRLTTPATPRRGR